MADAITVILSFVITLVIAMYGNGCSNSESVSISTEELETPQIILSRDESVSTAFSSIGTTTRSNMVNRSIATSQTQDYGMMIPLSTNATNAYPVEFIDPYYDYYEYKGTVKEVIEVEDQEVPTTQYVSFDPYDTEITNITGASSDQWNEFTDQLCDDRGYDSNHFLRGKGDVLSTIETDFNINPVALISIWVWESDIGNSTIGREKHNLAGIRSGSDYRYFDTYTECMKYHAKLLRERYVDKGLYSWQDIGNIYCPGNNEWPICIESTIEYYNEVLYKIMTR